MSPPSETKSTTATPSKDAATASKRLSQLTSVARSNSTASRNRRLSNAPTKSNSLNIHSTDELERDRAKIESLKALVTAAEEREADATQQCTLLRSKINQLSSTIDRMEIELGEVQDIKSQCERLTKEVDKLKASNKEHERAHLQLAEEFESSRAAWTEEEANLRAKLLTANVQLSSLQKESTNVEPQESFGDPPASSTILKTLPPSAAISSSPEEDQTAPLKAEVEALKLQKANIQASMEQALVASEALKAQLADLARVNEQLMDDNESYQILVGERTLMGGFDIKQLLRVDDDSQEIPPRTILRSSPRSSSTPSLEGVEEEDEEGEEDADAAIERAVLESHGNGSRTTGAVEAGITQTPKPKRIANLRKESNGMGLDLAAELAQAEDAQVQEARRKAEERKQSKKMTKDKDQEIKTLKDTNKALVLYISKILDRIAAHDGFEKVLSSDYGNKSPRSQRTQSPTAAGGIQSSRPVITTGASSSATTAPKRSSWLQYFTGIKSPPTQSNIKPLRLGTGTPTTAVPSLISAGLSAGWAGVKEQPEQEEIEEESRARERRLAEMKLHGLSSGTSSTNLESNNNSTVRANRRSTSMYGAGSFPAGFNLDQNRRNSGGAGKLDSNTNTTDPPSSSTLPPLTQAGILKRNEEREKESKINLEKGQASGFTEIEIRGHRMRPSTNRHSTAPAGPISPTLNLSQTSPNQQSIKAFPSNTTTTGIKGLKMTGDINNSTDTANESLFARTARRISMMGAGK